jgi:hypothetical protein
MLAAIERVKLQAGSVAVSGDAVKTKNPLTTPVNGFLDYPQGE